MPLASRKIRALIVDDEPLARRNITLLLLRDPEITIVGECGSGKDALASIRCLLPDLVFLDVQMPECDGFDVVEMLGAAQPPAIVFVTAYDQYALRAFEAGALDYLLKPFDNARFQRALDRAKQRIRAAHPAPISGRLIVKSAGAISFIPITEIDWIEADDYYARLHVGTKNYLLRRSLLELEQELDPTMFCRIHRSAIVNLEKVKTLKLNSEGEYNVVLENSAEIRLSRRYRQNLQSRLGVKA